MRSGVILWCLAALLTLNTNSAAAADIVDLLPSVLTRLTGPPAGPTPRGLLQVERATRAPLPRGPESPSFGAGFRYDPSVGAFVATTDEFGSLYAQVPDTLEQGHFAFAVNYVHVDIERLDGVELDDLRISVGGGLTARIDADVSTDALSLTATYGLLDDLNLDLAVPITRNYVRLKGSLDKPAGRVSARASRDVTGIGDMRFGAKYRVYNRDPFGLAGRLEVSVPTGDEDDFLGLGAFQVSPSLIAAARLPFGIRPHVNLAFRASSDTDKLNHQFFAATGVDWSPVSWVTLAADLLLTHLIDNDRPEARKPMGVGVPLETSSDDILDLGLGFKANVWRNVLLTGGVLIPLSDTGFRPDVLPMIGVEVPF